MNSKQESIERIAADILNAALSTGSARLSTSNLETAEENARAIASAYRVIHQAVVAAWRDRHQAQ